MKIASLVHIKILPALLAGLCLFACGDEEFTTTVSGKVINFGSKEPIEGVEVYLKDGIGSSFFGVDGNTSSDKRNETVTDENGEFTVTLTGSYEAALSMGKEGYEFDPDWNDGVSVGVRGYGYGGGNYENQVFELKAEAYFRGVFENSGASSDQDTLNITLLSYKSLTSVMALVADENPFVGKGPFQFYGPSDKKRVVGDRYLRFKLEFTRDGVWQTKIDSVYIKSFETFADTIYY